MSDVSPVRVRLCTIVSSDIRTKHRPFVCEYIVVPHFKEIVTLFYFYPKDPLICKMKCLICEMTQIEIDSKKYRILIEFSKNNFVHILMTQCFNNLRVRRL